MNNYILKPYRIIYDFSIELISPLIIGSGNSDNSDIDIIRDKEGQPFIPATSFAGVLRHYLKDNYSFNIEKYFGYAKGEENFASKIIFSDLIPEKNNINIIIRDGIRIDNKTGITTKQAKFDFEVVEPGAKFKSKIEIDGTDDDIEEIKKIIKTIDKDLREEKIRIGEKTNLGFGKIKLVESKYNFYNLREKDDIIKWLLREESDHNFSNIGELNCKDTDAIITLDFFIKDSLIVKHHSTDINAPDSTHIESAHKFVIPGTSIKGVFRARGERILNTLNIKNRKDFLRFLFGDSLENNLASIPSRLIVEEVIIKQNVVPGIQQRIKIDRFTGGTIKGALFDSMPIYAKDCKTSNTLKIIIKEPNDAEIGLLLLILKDLWTGDLAIGGEKNIGRGVLKGVNFSFKYKDFEIKERTFNNLNDFEKQELQKYVDSLNNNEFVEHLEKLQEKYQEVLNA